MPCAPAAACRPTWPLRSLPACNLPARRSSSCRGIFHPCTGSGLCRAQERGANAPSTCPNGFFIHVTGGGQVRAGLDGSRGRGTAPPACHRGSAAAPIHRSRGAGRPPLLARSHGPSVPCAVSARGHLSRPLRGGSREASDLAAPRGRPALTRVGDGGKGGGRDRPRGEGAEG